MAIRLRVRALLLRQPEIRQKDIVAGSTRRSPIAGPRIRSSPATTLLEASLDFQAALQEQRVRPAFACERPFVTTGIRVEGGTCAADRSACRRTSTRIYRGIWCRAS